MVLSAFLLPVFVCGTAFFINFIAMYYHASRAIPIGTMVSDSKSKTFFQGVPSGRRLGCIDLNFGCSTLCSILPWLMAVVQKAAGMLGILTFKVNPTHVHEQFEHPVFLRSCPVNHMCIK